MRTPRHLVTGIAGALVAIVALAGCSADANADGETIELTSNDWNPPAHPFNADGWEPFAEDVAAATDGALTITHYPSEGLGPVADTLTMLENGTTDMASTVVAYHPAELPLSQISAAMAWEDAALGAQAMWELCQQDPFRSELLAAGIVPIMCTSVSGYELFTNDAEIDAVPGAFDGRLVRATGIQGLIVDALGATPTSDSSTEIYLRMEQGSIDGTTAGWYTMPALSLDEVTNHATDGLDSWSAGLVVFGMSVERWESLDEDARDVLRDLGREYSLRVAQGIDLMDDEAFEAAQAEMALYEVSDEEREAVRAVVQTVIDEWVATTGSTLGLETEAQAAADVLASLVDIEPLPVDEWTPSTY